MTIAFTTVHGSRLYGLNHSASDRDSMIVYNDDRKAVHKKSGDDDVIHVGVYDLLEKAQDGSHQFLEGLFSQKKEWENDAFRPFLEHVLVPAGAVRPKYERTIKKFCYGPFKHRRHAARLSLFLLDLETWGRANPTLSTEDRLYVTWLAERYEGDELLDILVPLQ